jgi:hypothetical protein
MPRHDDGYFSSVQNPPALPLKGATFSMAIFRSSRLVNLRLRICYGQQFQRIVSHQAYEPGVMINGGLVPFNPVAASGPDPWPADLSLGIPAEPAPSAQRRPIRGATPFSK